jgi:DNA-cytosine methyltransferase
MNVLSLFDGMSCGQLALKKAGIKVDAYYAAEIDKHAIKVTQHNFPNTIQLGDVTKLFAKDLPKIDLIIGGSPCQGFSFAGKGLNFEDPRSKLFFEFVRLIKECNPKYFLLENVKMKKEHELVISQYMKVAPIEINSTLLSAQCRERLYWTNINQKPYGLFDDMITDIAQPKDKGLLLKDILESGFVDRDKAYCIDANYFKGTNLNQYKTKARRQIVFEAKNKKNVVVDLDIKPPFSFYECRTELGKESRRLAKIKTGKDTTKRSKEHKEYRPLLSQKANCLVTVDNPMNYIIDENYNYRKLTPLECERLQTVPDNYTNVVSDTQRYRMLGNGWTVDVIAHIFNHL